MPVFLLRVFPLAAVFMLSSAVIGSAGEIYTTDGGVAINGYDPVAYFTDHKPVKGSDKYTAVHEGATFHFASAKHRDAFTANPEHFAPQYGGYCAYGTAQGHKAPTEPQAFTIADGKLYLNYNDNVATRWRADVDGNIEKANANWDTVKKEPAP